MRQELIGYAEVWESRRRREFTLEEIALCRGIAQSAAIAIENARLYEQTRKRLAETTVLHKVAEIINATLDLNEVSERVVGELSETFGYRLVDICLVEEGGLRLQAQVGYDAETIIDFIPLERGVIGRVARTGEPAFITDVGQDPDYISSYPDITSEICVPIMSGKTLLGTLNVECDERRPLSNDDLQLLFTLSSHIGVAIENARFYEEEQRRSAQRNTIAEVGRRAAAILEMDALLPQVVDLIAQNFGYYRVHIFQMERNSEYAVYKAGTGKAGLAIAEEGLRLKVGEEGLVGWVARHGEPLLVNDVSQDPRYYSHPELPDTRSELDVPVRVAGRIIGVLDVQSTELNAFDESDVDTLQTLADQLAVAMENARLYQETERLAITDSLTGLHNLRYFYETLEKEIQRSERYHHSVSVIILDIDEFKAYNDLYGHLAGDDVLRELAQLMSKVTRQTDTLARYGGEEFTIILPETEIGGARFVAERLLEEVREHRFSMQDGQTTGRITISLGVATYPHHADDATALVDAADNALLQAKREGKDRVCVHELSAAQI
jgi:diguanylate cyclase (GGDEF)-like protein